MTTNLNPVVQEKMAILRLAMGCHTNHRLSCIDDSDAPQSVRNYENPDWTSIANNRRYIQLSREREEMWMDSLLKAIQEVGLEPAEVDAFLKQYEAGERGEGTRLQYREIGVCIMDYEFLRWMQVLLTQKFGC